MYQKWFGLRHSSIITLFVDYTLKTNNSTVSFPVTTPTRPTRGALLPSRRGSGGSAHASLQPESACTLTLAPTLTLHSQGLSECWPLPRPSCCSLQCSLLAQPCLPSRHQPATHHPSQQPQRSLPSFHNDDFPPAHFKQCNHFPTQPKCVL